MRELFGTDGIRGVAGEFPLDTRTTHAVGVALGRWVASRHLSPEVVIGLDTRESGTWIAAQVAGGLEAAGVKARFAGLITTPGVAFLARTGPFAAGVMISASHNPFHDNGIKIIDHSGYKLPDEQERELEGAIFGALEANHAALPRTLAVDDGLDRDYLEHLTRTASRRLDGVKIVVDAAHGAATYLAPRLFTQLGAEVDTIGCSPDGRNINLNCGSLHLESLRERVLSNRADLGIAFDGDADRALFVSPSGKLVDGDAVMLIAASALRRSGRLNEVIATVMSNLGLERALERVGIAMVRTQVGDKYVLAEMLRRGALLGGEQSGHVIFLDHATTGDGLLTALRVLDEVVGTGQDLDALTADLEIYPQRLESVRVTRRRPLNELAEVTEEVRKAEDEFGTAGRVLIRFSGTEPKARVMVEGPQIDRVEYYTRRIAAAIQTALG